MPSAIYPLVATSLGHGVPFLPIRIDNPIDNLSIPFQCLVDTGADATIITSQIAEGTGHNLRGDGVRATTTYGVGGVPLTTYGHTFRLHLLQHNAWDTVLWSSPSHLISCIEHDRCPPLLGTRDFLSFFNVTINYPQQYISLAW